MAVNEKVVILFKKENQAREEWDDDSFYHIGISGVVKEISEYGYLCIKTMNRVNLDIVGINPDRSISLTLSKLKDIQDLDETVAYQKLQALKQTVIEVAAGFNVGDWYTDFIAHVDSIGTIASSLSPFMRNLSNEEIYHEYVSMLEEEFQ